MLDQIDLTYELAAYVPPPPTFYRMLAHVDASMLTDTELMSVMHAETYIFRQLPR